MKSALGLVGQPALDYGTRFSRLRWQRATGAVARDLPPHAIATDALGGADLWFVVCQPSAIPVSAPEGPPSPDPGRVLVGSAAIAPGALAVHTLRELESAEIEPSPGPASEAPLLAFRTSEFPPLPGETVTAFLARLLADRSVHQWSPFLGAVCLEDPSERERPEILAALPLGAARLLDVGCGAAATSAAFRARRPGTAVTGIERDPALAQRARARLDRVLQGDAIEVLDRLAQTEERFDALLFADVLEHLEDPVRALFLARSVASADAVLVVSVPNVGHLSVVRDLLVGRFDPVPSGLIDAGHLRWFTGASLREFVEEAGWDISSMESVSSVLPPCASEFLARFSDWEALDRQSLGTYQWLVVARRCEGKAGTLEVAPAGRLE